MNAREAKYVAGYIQFAVWTGGMIGLVAGFIIGLLVGPHL